MFSSVLRKLRDEKGLNQTQLGKELNLAQRTISNYETGERFPNEIILNQIADYFDVSMDYLLGRTTLKKYTVKRKKWLLIGPRLYAYNNHFFVL